MYEVHLTAPHATSRPVFCVPHAATRPAFCAPHAASRPAFCAPHAATRPGFWVMLRGWAGGGAYCGSCCPYYVYTARSTLMCRGMDALGSSIRHCCTRAAAEECVHGGPGLMLWQMLRMSLLAAVGAAVPGGGAGGVCELMNAVVAPWTSSPFCTTHSCCYGTSALWTLPHGYVACHSVMFII